MNVIVTGGLQGIGRAVAYAYHAAGHTVVVFDLKDDDHEEVQQLRSSTVGYAQVDVSIGESIRTGFAKALAYFTASPSGGRLDVLINNAGITRDGLAVRMSEHDWDCVQGVNLKGAFLCAQQALKIMMPQRRGYLVNIASVVGQTGNAGQANYAASKAGLIALTKSLAQEYGSKNILVNAIAPGFIRTSMTDRLAPAAQEKVLATIPLRRFGTCEEVAQCVLFLTSGHADYLTGQVIGINGGMI